jgi:hypothetical protein
MTRKPQKTNRPALIVRTVAIIAVSALALAAPASAKSHHGHGHAAKSRTLQNDNSAIKQLFHAPGSIDAWKNAFPS